MRLSTFCGLHRDTEHKPLRHHFEAPLNFTEKPVNFFAMAHFLCPTLYSVSNNFVKQKASKFRKGQHIEKSAVTFSIQRRMF
jgi:hypothetical protein